MLSTVFLLVYLFLGRLTLVLFIRREANFRFLTHTKNLLISGEPAVFPNFLWPLFQIAVFTIENILPLLHDQKPICRPKMETWRMDEDFFLNSLRNFPSQLCKTSLRLLTGQLTFGFTYKPPYYDGNSPIWNLISAISVASFYYLENHLAK